MNMEMNALLATIGQVAPTEMFDVLRGLSELSERVKDLRDETAQRVIVQHIPDARHLVAITSVDYDDDGREVQTPYAFTIVRENGELMELPHAYSVLLGDWPENITPQLSEEQEDRVEALESGASGVWMDQEDAALTALAEPYGLTLEAIRQVIEAASPLVSTTVRNHGSRYDITASAPCVS